jgi:two-component system phosphate regulon sensor histidine kinase PhoR
MSAYLLLSLGIVALGIVSAITFFLSRALRRKSLALDSLRTELHQRIHDLTTELNGLKAIVSAMEEGLIVVDSQKRVLMANPAARKILELSEGKWIGQLLNAWTQQSELLSNIEMALRANQTCSFEFQSKGEPTRDGLPTKRHVLARCSPFRNETHFSGSTDQLQGAVAVLHDITELRRLERVRSEFVANVSHELRTPLTSLMGYLETLQESGWTDKDEADRFLQVCRRQAERLSHIVEDLLRLSRLENLQQEIAGSEIDLSEVINGAIDQSYPLAEDRQIQLEGVLPKESALIWGDRGLLTQALSNLIENAINYNREKGRVTVHLRSYKAPESEVKARAWEIAVEDTGIGIPPEAMGRIFERFYRVDKARSRERGGTGLGLSIVRHIALAHGASVHVESEPDKGSTFFLRFKAR